MTSYRFETPELNITPLQMEKMKSKLIKMLHCDIIVFDENNQEV
jgi:hypothetical protein